MNDSVPKENVSMLPQWFYIAGSLCFLVGTILSMVRK